MNGIIRSIARSDYVMSVANIGICENYEYRIMFEMFTNITYNHLQ